MAALSLEKEARKFGFESAEQRDTAIASGCLNMNSYDIMIKNMFSSAQEMTEDWNITINDIQSFSDEINIQEIRQIINNSKSPIEVSELHEKYKSLSIEAKPILDKVKSVKLILGEIVDIQSEDIAQPFKTITFTQIVEINQDIEKSSAELNKKLSISNEFEERIKRFTPIEKMLDVINRTEEGIPIPLTTIASLAGTTIEEGESIIKSLLEENSKIGRYLEVEQLYIRGEDIGSAIDDLLDAFAQSEKDKIGKIE